MFKLVSGISPETFSLEEDILYITIDIDWAPDFVIEHTIEILAENNVPSTWMVTHSTALLKEIISQKIFELGIHPNFNDLLTKTSRNLPTIDDRISSLIALVPNARSVRSHSMTQSSRILDYFSKYGLTHDCNHYIPFSSGIELRPWKIWNGMTKVPFGWEDDLDFDRTNRNFARTINSFKGLKVLNFHPIHIFLNSNSMKTYEETRPYHTDQKKLSSYINREYGTRDFLYDLIKTQRKHF